MQELADLLRRAHVEGGVFVVPARLEIRLSGVDVFRYLNGQVTRDLSRLSEGESLPACILTPKGKLCAALLIWRDGEDLIVESDPSLEEALTARLERYIVADDVTLSIEPSRPKIHVFGPEATREIWASVPGIVVSRLGQPGKDFDPTTPGALSASLLDSQAVEVLRIERGIPKWGAELTEETLPPEAGLDRTHIDYERGCYPGQEVISRLKSIGRVNRLLRRFHAPEGDPPVAGMLIVSAEGKEVGLITSVAPQIGSEVPEALGYAPRALADSGEPLFALDPLTGSRTPLSITETLGT